MNITAYQIAERFVGLKEIEGVISNPMIVAMLALDTQNIKQNDDEVAWCSAFVNYVAWILRLPRSKSLRARSWLNIGASISLDSVVIGFDVVIMKRGDGVQPGPEVIDAIGHVGFYSGHDNNFVYILGGNQSNTVKVSQYPVDRLLGIRRIGS